MIYTTTSLNGCPKKSPAKKIFRWILPTLLLIFCLITGAVFFSNKMPPPPSAYGISFLGKDKGQVLREWCAIIRSCYHQEDWDHRVFAYRSGETNDFRDAFHMLQITQATWPENEGIDINYIADRALDTDLGKESVRWDGFTQRLPDFPKITLLRLTNRCLTVWFNDSGVVTNQKVRIVYTYDSM